MLVSERNAQAEKLTGVEPAPVAVGIINGAFESDKIIGHPPAGRKPAQPIHSLKIQFIAAVIHEPELLILDEPFSGLDPVNMRLLRDLVLEQGRNGTTVIFSTHVMEQAEQICDHIVMIHDGRKVLDDSLTDIRRQFDPRTILFESMETGADVDPLRALPFVENISRRGSLHEISLVPGTNPAEAIGRIAGTVPAARVELHRPTLEDIFVRIVAEDGGIDRDALRADLHGAAVTREA